MEPINLKNIKHLLEEKRDMLLENFQQQDMQQISNRAINPGHSELAWRYEIGQRQVLLLTRVHEQLKEIEAALQRLENGTYRKCQNCGQDINPRRLRVLMTASMCIRCKKQAK